MGRNRGIGQKRKGKQQGAPTPTKKSRRQVQQVSAEKAKKHLHDTTEVENWITKMNEIASEAGVAAKKGLGYGAGEARIIIGLILTGLIKSGPAGAPTCGYPPVIFSSCFIPPPPPRVRFSSPASFILLVAWVWMRIKFI